jgi:hypothetical protein
MESEGAVENLDGHSMIWPPSKRGSPISRKTEDLAQDFFGKLEANKGKLKKEGYD